ncbi:RelA/SpoT family protein [Streptomyces tsukubensis]|uniref:Bifunctional (P)ppGpp synthetase/guanosine-3',5'-bis(Diphosphate) 3'-pyrophosphohydrolase n=1 Tax=Streptomyces tsukubensis TaxID=83656 RepID=A0A1V4A4L6_9ACTN|nr:HD domain-containing protein [Streptomyces tsukubensis]OON75159.1 bifunctional (p)ppGpp synthetase/guanosine-3',5'-bis(diphosphate) 3'-pyrophosphohydrolase [Streptomyces tsukubensis]QFR96095.1 HD domain-containing protein [Streptomyces tsukubensis]
MSAEAMNPATPGAVPDAFPLTAAEQRPGEAPARRRGRPRIDLRRLGRAALMGPASRDRLPDAIGHVAEAHRAHYPHADLEPLRSAYVLAESSHRGQTRKSGEPYITHPLAVTLILAELGAETTTLTASLLHDTVEDTDVTLDQVGRQFGEEVRYLVDGVTKLEKVEYGAAAEPETFRKMLVATGNDVRVMSIKLADRLHNVRTLGVMRPEKQARIAKVTRDVLIPLAERLGVQALKTELEDLVFAILHPEEYEHTRKLIDEHAARPDPLAAIADEVRGVLREAGLSGEVHIRPRHFVSVHRVRRKRGELRGADFGRLLVLVNEDADCYGVLGELHTCFTPVVSQFKDFIAVPKFNLYQSLHTAVARRDGEVAEVLIRTHRMHKVAEAGVVALGNPYAAGLPAPEAPGQTGQEGTRPGGEGPEGERSDPTRPGWLSRFLDWQRSAPDSDTFWSTLREDLAQDREITVFRADGGSLGLPEGASCVDAAYAQYGEDAHAAMGARVNGRLATLSTVLSDGDTVQLLMGQGDIASSGPSPAWLDHTRTPGARIAIRRWLLAHPESPEPPARAATRPPFPAPSAPPAFADVIVDLPKATVRLAGCCTPVPPDAITAFAVRGGAVTVHRTECPGAAAMRGTGRAPVGAHWGETGECRVTLFAESFGRPRLLADLTEAIAQEGVAVISATVEPPSEQRVRHTYTLQLPDAALLPGLMRAMREVPGVYDVHRAQYAPTSART